MSAGAIVGPVRYASLKDKIRAEKAERTARYAGFSALMDKAHDAGMAAAALCNPTPMAVAYESGGERRVDIINDGVCGFAWVTVHPATCSFARWYTKTHPGTRRAYGGGVTVCHVGLFNQSMDRKAAYAGAFADVLRDAGIKAYAQSRMD